MNTTNFSKLRMNLDMLAQPVKHDQQHQNHFQDLKLAQYVLKKFMLPKSK